MNYEGDPKYSIVDITFSTKDTKELENLNKMSSLRLKIDKLKDKIDATKQLMKIDHKKNFIKNKKQIKRLAFFEKMYKTESNRFLKHHIEEGNILGPDNEHLSAFVIFQSTDAKNMIKNAYDYSWKYRMLVWVC